MSASVWVYFTAFNYGASGYNQIFGKRNSVQTINFITLLVSQATPNGGQWTFQNRATNIGSLSLNTWTHLGASYDSVAGSFAYINGVLSGSNSTTNGAIGSDNGDNFWIGADDPGSGATTPDVIIADLATWRCTLSAAEIYALSKGARPDQIRGTTAMIAWWRLDGYGHPALDRISGRGGVLTGTTFATGPPLLNAAPILASQPFRNDPMIFIPPPVFVLMPQIVT
jgi:hypothetical protein